jgi:predicted TPR repeat methyltransferase
MQNLARDSHELYLKSYSCQNEGESKAVYGAWAENYDAQMQRLQWQAPRQIAELLAAFVPESSRARLRVLDVGAGTGLVGEALSQLGFRLIDAFDLSGEMLKHAVARGLYQRCIEGNAAKLSQRVESGYDALLCVGALNFGHIAANALREMQAVVRPGGLIAFSTREDYYQQESQRVQDAMAQQGLWRLLERKIRDTSIADMRHLHWLYEAM